MSLYSERLLFLPKTRAAVTRATTVPQPSKPQPGNYLFPLWPSQFLTIVPEVQTEGYSAGPVTIAVYCLSLWGQSKID
jgi:hypothetical protein